MLAALLALAAATAATPAAPPKPPPVDCRDAAHRALDFWVGDWTVSDTASGKPVAVSRIESILGGCAIRETYDQTVGPNGQPIDYHGTSYSALNTADVKWRQLYVDTGGGAPTYFGGMEGAQMVLTATAGSLGTRMAYTPLPDGAVRQTGAVTQDGGQTWTPGYDFTYRRR